LSIAPSSAPTTIFPSDTPSNGSELPTLSPSTPWPSDEPSFSPTIDESGSPSSLPSGQPTIRPSPFPSQRPSTGPSIEPSLEPTSQPSEGPSRRPSVEPSLSPTSSPSTRPSIDPTSQPVVARIGEEEFDADSDTQAAEQESGFLGGATIILHETTGHEQTYETQSDKSLDPAGTTQVIQRQSQGARPWKIMRNNKTGAG
jgi:hypothetical protein